MKSILSASWLLTVAVGNLVVVLVAESKLVANQVYEYILFAGLLLVATVIFIIICCYYKYIEDEESHGEEDENDDDSSVSTSKKLSLNYEKQSNGSFKVKTSHGIFNKSTYHSNLF
jgi:hypothetical protein